LANRNIVSLYWLPSRVFGSVKLFVRPEDAEAAKSILNQAPPEKFDVEGIGEYIQPSCPDCQSNDVSFEGPDKEEPRARSFVGPSVSVIPQDEPQYWKCHACGRIWKDLDSELPPDS
jgi:hypothetical protein